MTALPTAEIALDRNDYVDLEEDPSLDIVGVYQRLKKKKNAVMRAQY